MQNVTPLRYPGGKAPLADLLGQFIKLNRLGAHSLVEPFAGGAGASLRLLFDQIVNEIVINDLDPSVYAFWRSIHSRPVQFISLLENVDVSIKEWHKQKAIYAGNDRSLMRRGFATFFLNRCNRSGIIMNGGPIGGIDQKGDWKIDARFNREELIRRIKRIHDYRDRIDVQNTDAIELIRDHKRRRSVLFLDPPYFHKGSTLYLNALDPAYHRRLSQVLRAAGNMPWIMTYDDCTEVRKLYRDWARIRPFTLAYSASNRRKGREILITPHHLEVPRSQDCPVVGWQRAT